MIAEQIGGRASEQFFDARRYFRQGGGISGHLVQMLGATVQAHMTHGRLRDAAEAQAGLRGSWIVMHSQVRSRLGFLRASDRAVSAGGATRC